MLRPRIQQYASSFRIAVKLLDVIAIALGLYWLICWQPKLNSDSTLVGFLLAIGIFSIVAELTGLYRNWQTAIEREIMVSLGTWAITVVVLSGLGQFSYSTLEYSATGLMIWSGVTPVFMLGFRTIARQISRWLIQFKVASRGFAIYGANDLGIELADGIKQSPELGFRFVGFYDDRPEKRSAKLPEHFSNRLGRMEDLVEQAKSSKVEVVFISLPMAAEERIREVITRLSDTTASAYIVPDVFTFQLLHSRMLDVNGIPVISVYENPLYGVDGLLKRIADVFLSLVGIVLLSIPMALIAMLVKLTSKGPVIFRQKRYGLDGREINVWKFRSMTVCENGTTVKQATANDARLTSIGGFLRRTSLDELPQLFNVFSGTMSLVGPRPHANSHNEYYRKEIDGYMLRHKVKPGITGLAQVNGCRGETETIDKMEQRVRFDHRYIREWSMLLDAKILWKTFFVVFSKQNAY